jgi:hypothetical protein
MAAEGFGRRQSGERRMARLGEEITHATPTRRNDYMKRIVWLVLLTIGMGMALTLHNKILGVVQFILCGLLFALKLISGK